MHAVVPAEVNVVSTRVHLYEDIKAKDHEEMMKGQLLSLDEVRASAEDKLRIGKKKTADWYNKKVRRKRFEVGDLVWKVIFPVGVRSHQMGKWSPS